MYMTVCKFNELDRLVKPNKPLKLWARDATRLLTMLLIRLATIVMIFSSAFIGVDAYAEQVSQQVSSSVTPSSQVQYLGDLREITQRGKLVVALPNVDRHSLFAIGKNGDLQGYYIDVARNIGKELGVSVEFNRSAKNFNEVVELVAQGKADIAICHLSKTLGRIKQVLFANTDVTLYQTLMVSRVWLTQHANKDGSDDPVAALKTNRFVIGVSAGSSYVGFAKQLFPLVTIQELPIEKLFASLFNNRVDAILYDDYHVQEQLLREPNIVLKYRSIVLKRYPDFIAMAVQPGKWGFLHWLNSYLEINLIDMNTNKLLQYIQQHNL